MAGTSPVRRKKRHFHKEATAPPFDLEMETREDGSAVPEGEDAPVITLKNVQKLPSHSAFDLVRVSQTDPEKALRIIVGEENWPWFWAEWRDEPFDAVQQLMNDAMEHYSGVTPGN